MYRVIIFILMLAGELCAQAKDPTNNELVSNRTDVNPISCMLTGEARSQPTGMYVVRLGGDSTQNWIYADFMPIDDHWRQKAATRTDAGEFIVGMIGHVMAVAVPVQRFINEYSSYDYGENRYDRPTIHIQTHVSRGSIWLTARVQI